MKSFLQIVVVICFSVCELGVLSYSLFDNRTLIVSDSEIDDEMSSLPRNRTGRLFFDELFGLGGYTDRSEESADNSVRTCNCGNDFTYVISGCGSTKVCLYIITGTHAIHCRLLCHRGYL